MKFLTAIKRGMTVEDITISMLRHTAEPCKKVNANTDSRENVQRFDDSSQPKGIESQPTAEVQATARLPLSKNSQQASHTVNLWSAEDNFDHAQGNYVAVQGHPQGGAFKVYIMYGFGGIGSAITEFFGETKYDAVQISECFLAMYGMTYKVGAESTLLLYSSASWKSSG